MYPFLEDYLASESKYLNSCQSCVDFRVGRRRRALVYVPMMSNLVLPPCLVTLVIGLAVDGVASESTFLFFSFFYFYIHG